MKRETILLSVTVVAALVVLFSGTFWIMRPHPARAFGANPDPFRPFMMGDQREKGMGQANSTRQ